MLRRSHPLARLEPGFAEIGVYTVTPKDGRDGAWPILVDSTETPCRTHRRITSGTPTGSPPGELEPRRRVGVGRREAATSILEIEMPVDSEVTVELY